jgi:DNA-binding MarR family transcriptional regulator
MNTRVEVWACRGCHCLAARRRARAITRVFEARLRPHRLRATQFSVLAALALKGPTRVGSLAETLGLERTTLTRVAAVLQQRGWIRLAPGADGRERPFRLTATGWRTLEAAFPAWQEAQALVEHDIAKGSETASSPS